MSAREIVALIAVANLECARAVIEARKQAEYRAARDIVLTGEAQGLEVGQTVLLGGELYRIASPAVGGTLRI